MKITKWLITPKLAERILHKNSMNRYIKPHLVQEYVRMMTNGLWMENTGITIKIADDGTLLDGQHRLHAVIKSGVSLNFDVAEGVDKSVIKVVDTHSKRTAGDLFKMTGIKNAKSISSGIKYYYMLKRGYLVTTMARKLSNSEILDLYQERMEFWDEACNYAAKWYEKSNRILTQTDFIGLYAFFFDIDPDDAYYFMEALSSGAGLDANDPIFILRGKLTFSKINPQFNLLPSVRTALIFKAWNYMRDGAKIKILKVDPQRENFPVCK